MPGSSEAERAKMSPDELEIDNAVSCGDMGILRYYAARETDCAEGNCRSAAQLAFKAIKVGIAITAIIGGIHLIPNG